MGATNEQSLDMFRGLSPMAKHEAANGAVSSEAALHKSYFTSCGAAETLVERPPFRSRLR